MLFILNILKGFWHFYFPCLHNFQVQNFPGTLQHYRLVSISTYSKSVTHRLLRIPEHRQVDYMLATSDLFPQASDFNLI